MATVRINYNGGESHHIWESGDEVQGTTPNLSLVTTDNETLVLREFESVAQAEEAAEWLVDRIDKGLQDGGTEIIIDVDDF